MLIYQFTTIKTGFLFQWGKIKGQQVTFDKMGKDIVYLPTYYAKGKSIPAGQPFWFKS